MIKTSSLNRRFINIVLAVLATAGIITTITLINKSKEDEITNIFNPNLERTYSFKAFDAYQKEENLNDPIINIKFTTKGFATLGLILENFSKITSDVTITYGEKHALYGKSVISINGYNKNNYEGTTYWNTTSSTHRLCIGDGNSVSNRKNSCKTYTDDIIFNNDDIDNEFTWYLTRWE